MKYFMAFKNIMLGVIAVLMGVLLVCLACGSGVEVSQSRTEGTVIHVTDVSGEEKEEDQAPLGMVLEYRFRAAENIDGDTCLAFYVSHHYVAVYIDDTNIYSLRTAGENPIVKTVGSSWVMLPLYREDSGKEIRVVLTPVYKSYSGREVEFLIGPALRIYQSQLLASLPELLLCIVNFVMGAFVMSLAGYYMSHRRGGAGLLASGILAVAVGLWRICDTRFTPFVARESAVLCYTVSVSMMMLVVIMLLKATKSQFRQAGSRLMDYAGTVAELIFAVQLLLQILDLQDLRETLFITHASIVTSVLLVVGTTLYEWIRYSKWGKQENGKYTVWILACGALADLIMYYVRDTSSGLLFIQIALLFFNIMEGVRFFRSYTAQEQRLLEKELQLTQSRSITMMRQIRSHFVFNILNAISGMCKYDPKKADETVVQLARYLRGNIDIMQEDVPVTFAAILRHLEDFVALEQIRFGDKVRFETDIQEENFMLPPLILQPLVENAIKHGLTPKPTGGTVVLSTRADGDLIRITVADDGVGFNTAVPCRTGAIGLENVRFRLTHMAQGEMSIESIPGQGTTVTVTLPRKEIDACM